jgi:hypothetical protein
MRKWFQSVALIRRLDNGQSLWLAREGDTPGVLNFIAAPRLEKESFRETIRREVAWVLDLDPQRDLLVSNMAQVNLEFAGRLPGDDEDSHIAAAFFMVEPYGNNAHKAIRSDPENHWLTSSEVCSGRLAKGQVLEPALVYLLERAKVINAWD